MSHETPTFLPNAIKPISDPDTAMVSFESHIESLKREFDSQERQGIALDDENASRIGALIGAQDKVFRQSHGADQLPNRHADTSGDYS